MTGEGLHDEEAEWDVIASCLWLPAIIPAVLTELSTADLGERSGQVFEALKRCHKAGAVDAVLVAAELQAAGADQKLVLRVFEADRTSRTIARNASRHARRLHSLGLLRRLRAAGASISDLVRPGVAPEDVIAEATRMLRALGETVSSSTLDAAGMTRIVERSIEKNWLDERVISTKLPTADHLLDGGMIPGRFYVVGARPGVGKSTLLSSIARTALDKNVRTLFVSLEMTPVEVMGRLLANAYGVDSKLTTEAIRKLYSDRTQAWPIVYGGGSTVGQIVQLVRERADLGLVVVDYLQLLRPERAAQNREREIAEMTRDLKLLAEEAEVPVLVASQVNRKPTGRQSSKPRMEDLRESGSIENDADVVMLLHRDDPALRGTLNIAKNRHGRTGIVDVEFAPQSMAFHEVLAQLPIRETAV